MIVMMMLVGSDDDVEVEDEDDGDDFSSGKGFTLYILLSLPLFGSLLKVMYVKLVSVLHINFLSLIKEKYITSAFIKRYSPSSISLT